MVDVANVTRSEITFELLKQTVSFPDVVQLLGYELDASNKIISPFNPDERTASHLFERGDMQVDPADLSRSEITFELLKSTVSMYEVVELLGFELDSNNFFRSPLNPDERTPSTKCWEDHWWDFSQGVGGDAVDLVKLLNPDMKVSDIIWKLWHKAIRAGREPGDVEREQPRELVDFSDRIANMPVYTGMIGGTQPPRGAVLARFDELWIPHRDGDLVYGVKIRHPDGSKTALPGSQFGHKLYDPEGWKIPAATHVILTEGESDCWAMMSAVKGWQVLALPSGASTWKDHWMETLEHCADIRVCMDRDRAGKTAQEKIIRKLGHGRALPLDVPPLYGDAREAIEAGWRPNP